MANARRTDTGRSVDHPPAVQQPIILARLPRVGAAAPTTVATIPMPPSSPSMQAMSEQAPAMPSQRMSSPTIPPSNIHSPPEPESMPRLDLRSQIDERIKLHTADSTTEQGAPSTVYFADRQHQFVQAAQPVVRQPAPASTTKHTQAQSSSSSTERKKHTQHRNHDRPATVSEKLFQLHGQLSPHAGLIVALALVASAGLLYWMIVGPAQVPNSQFDSFGSEGTAAEYGMASHEMPNGYVPQFTAELPAPETVSNTSSDPDQWEEVTLPTPEALAPETDLEPKQLPPPELNLRGPRQAKAADSVPLLRSQNPDALDFTRVLTPSVEMAVRPSATTNQ